MRSDTFTLPSSIMLETILSASLGDDVYGEDITVNELEKICAEMFCKDAAILMPSGTMANLATLMSHCSRGTKAIVGDESDIYLYEAGGASVCGGIIYEPIKTQTDGTLLLSDIERVMSEDWSDPQFARPTLICIENPHNRMGGIPLNLDYLKNLYKLAHEINICVHMDGARVFNAAISQNITVDKIAEHVDSLQFCLSKSLSAPIGSIVLGNQDFICKVRRVRKMLGGGMRQAGIIAAPALYALKNMLQQLVVDHANAKYLVEGLSKINELRLDSGDPQTNMVFFKIDGIDTKVLIKKCYDMGLNIAELGHKRIRMVTHSGVNKEDISKSIQIIDEAIKSIKMNNIKGTLS